MTDFDVAVGMIRQTWPGAPLRTRKRKNGRIYCRAVLPRAKDGATVAVVFDCVESPDAFIRGWAAMSVVTEPDGTYREHQEISSVLAGLLNVQRIVSDVPCPGGFLDVNAGIVHDRWGLKPLGFVNVRQGWELKLVVHADVRDAQGLAIIQAFCRDETAALPLIDYFMGVEG